MNARSEAGFVLFDALLAVALVAVAGGSVIAIATSMLDQQARELDRSVALIGAQSLIQQYVLLGAVTATDELYRYEIVLGGMVAGTTVLRQAEVVAEPLTRSPAARIAFLAPVAMP